MFTLNNTWGSNTEQDTLSNSLFGNDVVLTSINSNEFSTKREDKEEKITSTKCEKKCRITEKSEKLKKRDKESSRKKDDVENQGDVEIISAVMDVGAETPISNNKLVKTKKLKLKKKAKQNAAIVEQQTEITCDVKVSISSSQQKLDKESSRKKEDVENQGDVKVIPGLMDVIIENPISNNEIVITKKLKLKKKAKKLAAMVENQTETEVKEVGISSFQQKLLNISNDIISKEEMEKIENLGNDVEIGNNEENKKWVEIETGLEQIIDKNDKNSLLAPAPKKKRRAELETILEQSIENNQEDSLLAPAPKKFKFQGSSKYNKFQNKIMEKLKGGQFRYINEKLYTCESSVACSLFVSDPKLFDVYHKGFHTQVQQWPQNPVDIIIEYIKSQSKQLVVADFGCGEAKISKSVPNQVHSFDLVAVNEQVTACDMTNVPLSSGSVNIAVFCLSLMGTNLVDFLSEAHRVLKPKGVLKIAEVKSRFEDVKKFMKGVSSLGFTPIEMDDSNKMFVMMQFVKTSPSSSRRPNITLQPCIYKRR